MVSLSESLLNVLSLPSPLQVLSTPWTESSNIKLYIKRDDLIHPLICGNKWRKLKYSLIEMHGKNYNGIITLGGAYSNHLVALAAAGYYGGFRTVGIVRSYQEYLENPSLDQCRALGMRLYFVHPESYQLEEESDVIQNILSQHKELFFLPVGGSSAEALRGIGEMWQEVCAELDREPDYCITSIGSGATLAGILNVKSECTKLIGVSPFKAAIDNLHGLQYVEAIASNYTIVESTMPQLRFGGYNVELVKYINRFNLEYNIQLDPIYTARAMLKLEQMCKAGSIVKNASVVFLHTGGLQGIAGYNYQYAKKEVSIKMN